jgi:sugar O-acyltransferase (sialic acid O-acetyltransferase NeuD family)
LKTICLIGYSGHSFVVYDCFFSQGQIVTAYTEKEEKKINPFSLKYLGNEDAALVKNELSQYDFFVCVGNNLLRRKITKELTSIGSPVTALHKSAIISRNIQCGEGVMFGPRVIVNSLSDIGYGVILNSGCIVEHECKVGNFSHIAPGAILCGNVEVGENTFIGAGTVVKPGVKIGKNVITGAGSVVLDNIPDGNVYVGNPAKKIMK